MRGFCRIKDEKIGDIDTEWQTYFGSSNVFSQLSFLSLVEIFPKIYTECGVAIKRCVPQHRQSFKTDYKQASPDFFVALEFEVTLFNISCFSGFFHFCLTGCPQGWTSVHGGSCYQAETRNFMNFSVAAKSCKTTSGAYLVEIQSQSENEFVAGLSIQDFWIGYRAQAKDLPWIWSNSGVVGSYTNWNTGQPNFFPQTQPFCAIIWRGRQPGSKTWDDSWCGNGRFFVCETGT